MKLIAKMMMLVLLATVIVSCASGPSLQKYYIDNEGDKNFRQFDIPASVLTLKEDASQESKEALASLKKLNILAFVNDGSNAAAYANEDQKVKAILKNDRFKELMRVKDKGRNIVVKYEGDEETMDEVIVYAKDKTQGFALVRVLGNNMDPAKIVKLANSIGDVEGEGIKSLEGLFKDIKIE